LQINLTFLILFEVPGEFFGVDWTAAPVAILQQAVGELSHLYIQDKIGAYAKGLKELGQPIASQFYLVT
jgi:hypothetical protein